MDAYGIRDVSDLLKCNKYPGRGILLGISPCGRYAVAAYFIMGRSANSRNRLFVEEQDGIRTEAFRQEEITDPSLIIYRPVRQVGRELIVTNGDQTDTVREYILMGKTFQQALRTRCFEPDGPNWTPRISGLLSPDGSCKLSILKSADKKGSACIRNFFEYPAIPGAGRLLHTYQADGDPLPPFSGEPRLVSILGDIDEFAERIWDSLDGDNRISLFLRYTDMASGRPEQRIINKNQKRSGV